MQRRNQQNSSFAILSCADDVKKAARKCTELLHKQAKRVYHAIESNNKPLKEKGT